MNLFDERIHALQKRMKEDGLKAYLIPATDPHMSEECAPYFAAERFYFCPFQGSDGTLLVTLDHYYIYTDGRFWTEAEGEIKGSECILLYGGKRGVPSLVDFVKENDLYPLGMDESLFSISDYLSYAYDEAHQAKVKNISYRSLVENLPSFPMGKIWKLDESLLSTTREERVKKVMEPVFKNGAKSLVITTLDDIAYLLGYRGSDIPCTPIFYSYLYIEENLTLHLFMDPRKLPEGFKEDNVILHPYEEFYAFLKEREEIPTQVDLKTSNALVRNSLKHIVYATCPAIYQKSVKGKVEIENTKEIQAIDGLAVLKLMKYIDDNIDKGNLSEYSCAEYLDKTRRENPRCFDLSFETIAAADSNAAMMHYAPTKEKHASLTRDNQLLLVDSGGQYYGGTTDTTRTFIVSKHVSGEVKHDYTLTLKSQIALSTSIFEEGCSGHEIDIKAREVMWKEGLDYKCGTGHGVGYISCVHEGPIGFRYYHRPGVEDEGRLTEGQIITIEPGVYKDGLYGIRLENNLLITKAFETSQGYFMKFETITYAPYDRRGIDISMLDDSEIAWFNDYSEMVFEKLAPLCQNDASLLAYLRKQTEPLKR